MQTRKKSEGVVSVTENREIKWTDAQLLAQRKRGNTVVSAAAGSGKTAVLVEKIVRLLGDPDVSLDQMLIVTYTKNAADDLRVKIGKRLTELAGDDPKTARHLEALPRAVIGTIHSFLLKIIKEYYSRLDLTPSVSVIDSGDRDALSAAAADEVLDDLFSSGEEVPADEMRISSICDVLGGVSRTEEYVPKIYDALRSRGYDADKLLEYAEILDEWAERDYLSSPWGEVLRSRLSETVEHLRNAAEPLIPQFSGDPAFRKTVEVSDRYFELLRLVGNSLNECDFEKLRRAVATYDKEAFKVAGNGGKNQAAERFAALKNNMKKVLVDCSEFKVSSREISDAMKREAEFVRGFARAVARYGAAFEEKKRERGRVDYQDLESFALKLFVGNGGVPTDIAGKVGEKYKFIFVDEYQDANGVQDSIFRAIGENAELFFVGDVKQSIYRFRGAEPRVFSDYRVKWESVSPSEGEDDVTEPENASVFMSTNFRCSRPVIEFSNLVSRRTFPYGNVPFRKEDELIFGASADVREPVVLYLVSKEKGKKTEEQLVAEKIREMLGTNQFGMERALIPDDFAILIPTNDSGKPFADALDALGVPSTLSDGVDMSEQGEVILALDILRATDNPYRDGPLAGMMFSSICGFTLDDLVNVRASFPDGPLFFAVEKAAEEAGEELREKCAALLERLRRYRAAERSTPADAFVEFVFNDTGIMNAPEVVRTVNGTDRVRRILDFARKYEDGEFGGLFGFLSYIDGMIESGSFNYTPDKSGAVRIMTEHKSKGLEFPVCFIGKAAKKYSDIEYRNPIQFDPELGIGSFLPGEGGYTKYDSPVRRMIVEKKKGESAEEEMRLLYVAMTRAKYKLVVTATCDPEGEIEKARESEWTRDRFTVRSANRPLDHILGAALEADPSVCVTVTVTEEGETVHGARPEAVVEERRVMIARADEAAERAKENFSFEYPYSFLSNLPAKLAVSKLYPEVLDEGEAVLTDDEEPVIPDDGDMPYPTFMTGTTDFTPADKGTANHVFMQFCDFDRLAEGSVKEEIDRLVSKGFMTAKMGELVEEDFIIGFIRGDLFGRMKNAREALREFRFNVRLPAEQFTSDPVLAEKYAGAGAKVTVQGVFDCVFRENDGRIVLVDYKTDAMTSFDRAHPDLFAEKLRNRHKTQLTYYKEAAALIFGREPDETLIWSLPMGKSVSVL
ncbi:MAG: UvrD-helicase domain-containing protein [Clostridia bacterium]|nr:UvrD-helicase domain-containing protein [Clostridia bacterium]